MPRLPQVSREDVVKQAPQAFARLDRQGQGKLFDIHLVMGNAPNLFQAFMEIAMEVRHGCEVDGRLRELAIVTVARATGSAYELDHHWPLALREGVRRDQLEALAEYETSDRFDDLERAVMRLAEVSTRSVHVPDDVWKAVHDRLGDRRTMELVFNIGVYNMVARIAGAADLATEPWFDRERGVLRELAADAG